MLICLRIASLAVVVALLTTAVWGQQSDAPGQQGENQPVVAPHHDIPADALGNFIRIVGHCNSKSPASPNGHFNIRFPRRAARGVQMTTGQIAISGAKIDQAGVQSNRMIKSTTDYVTFNQASTAVEFSTRTQDGVLKLPLIAEKDAQVVVVVYLETADDVIGYRYFLSGKGLSFEPVKKAAGKKRK